jgi:hypothetical protein
MDSIDAVILSIKQPLASLRALQPGNHADEMSWTAGLNSDGLVRGAMRLEVSFRVSPGVFWARPEWRRTLRWPPAAKE